MFLDLSVDDYANALYLANRRLMPTSPMWLNNPADPNSPIAVRVLGTATVGANNTAELSLKMLMPGARRIVAVFLGNSSPLTARTTGHDAEVTLAADVHDAWAARQALIQRQYNYCTAVFNSSITGSLVLSGSGSLTLSTVILAGSTTWMTTPVVQPELRPAISDESALAVKVATGMVGGVSSGRTLTNPPSLWFQMTGLAGTMGTAPVVPSRGSIHTASASVLLTVPVPAPDPASTGFGSGACINLGFGGTLTISHPAIPYDPEPPLPNPDPAPQATGSVRIYDGDVLIDTVALDASFSGVYVPQPGSLALGTHQFYFVYDGNDDFAGFTHEDSVEITQTPTSVSLTKSVNWLAQGDSVTITANVSTATPDTVTPTGTVHFLVDGTEVAAVELGSTTPLTLTLPLGAHTIAAQYPGDNNCLPSDAVMSLLVASPAPTPTQLPAFPSIVKPSTMAVTAKVQGRQLKLMASVLDKQTRKPVAGAVEWRLDGKRVAASSIGKLLTLTPKLAKGVHTLTAVYNATLGYNTATQTLKLKATAGGITIVR